jgi:hypothetical protein
MLSWLMIFVASAWAYMGWLFFQNPNLFSGCLLLVMSYVLLQQIWLDFLREPNSAAYGIFWVKWIGHKVEILSLRSASSVYLDLRSMHLGPWYCEERLKPDRDPDSAKTLRDYLAMFEVTIYFLRKKDKECVLDLETSIRAYEKKVASYTYQSDTMRQPLDHDGKPIFSDPDHYVMEMLLNDRWVGVRQANFC